jgi:hypothetical protein
MEKFERQAEKSAPGVLFDPETGILLMEGQAYPENATLFFEPILLWLQEYLQGAEGKVVFETNLTYLNTSSTKALMMILDLFEEAHLEGKDVTVRWKYQVDNEMGEEYGNDFMEDLSLPFELIMID